MEKRRRTTQNARLCVRISNFHTANWLELYIAKLSNQTSIFYGGKKEKVKGDAGEKYQIICTKDRSPIKCLHACVQYTLGIIFIYWAFEKLKTTHYFTTKKVGSPCSIEWR